MNTLTLTCVLAAAGLAAMVRPLLAQTNGSVPASNDPALRPPDYQPSGDYYDWRRMSQPERPWHRPLESWRPTAAGVESSARPSSIRRLTAPTTLNCELSRSPQGF